MRKHWNIISVNKSLKGSFQNEAVNLECTSHISMQALSKINSQL